MADLFWPGDERAGTTFDRARVLDAVLEVEQQWLEALVRAGIAPAGTLQPVVGLDHIVGVLDLERISTAAEASGNPVVPVLALLRERLAEHDDLTRWLHRGLTSQDVVDTALMVCAREATTTLLDLLDDLVRTLSDLAARHRHHVMAGRTLTQHAVPVTFGLKAAQWLQGVLDARDDLRALRFPAQVGGAAGTLAAVAEIAGDPDAARFLAADTALHLGLDPAPPWHTHRAPLTRYADALVRTTDALGHVANDVLLLARPEIGELAEPSASGRGGSSTMPHKANPVLSVLVRRAALSAPQLGAQLHLAAALAVDERPDGSWHTEWPVVASLSRLTVTAASQGAELLRGLRVDTARMAATVKQHADGLLAERAGIRSAAGLPEEPTEPARYLGAADGLVEEILERAAGTRAVGDGPGLQDTDDEGDA